MPTTQLSEFIPVLQVAIGPVILISGAGLLLLSLTNRFGRAVDRSRQIIQQVRTANETDRQRLAGQIAILYRRARLLQVAITFSALSILLAAILIIMLFSIAMLKLELAILISLVFMTCLTALIVSLVAFIAEVRLSLTALRLELNV